MATPHIAGLVATIISRDGNDTPAAISTKIQALSTKGALSSIREHLFISIPVPCRKIASDLPHSQPPARSTTSLATSLKHETGMQLGYPVPAPMARILAAPRCRARKGLVVLKKDLNNDVVTNCHEVDDPAGSAAPGMHSSSSFSTQMHGSFPLHLPYLGARAVVFSEVGGSSRRSQPDSDMGPS